MLSCQLGDVLDLSASGAQVRAKRSTDIAVGNDVALELRYQEQLVRVKAAVVWVERRWLKRPTVGLRFIDVPPATASSLTTLALASADRATVYTKTDQPRSRF